MNVDNVLKPGEKEIVKSPYGTYIRYYLSVEELQIYRDLPPDPFWEKNSRPIMAPGTFKNKNNRINRSKEKENDES